MDTVEEAVEDFVEADASPRTFCWSFARLFACFVSVFGVVGGVGGFGDGVPRLLSTDPGDLEDLWKIR